MDHSDSRERLHATVGTIGVWSSAFGVVPSSIAKNAAREVEALGYRTIWYQEAFEKESFTLAGLLLSWTDRIAVAQGVANIYARDPVAAANAARTLAEAYPGRFVAGFGPSSRPPVEARGHSWCPPIETTRAYLEAIERAPYEGPQPTEAVPRVLGVIGPRMLQVAAESADGILTYFVPVAHTALVRDTIGRQPFLAVEQAVLLESNPQKARAIARLHVGQYLAIDHYRRNLLRMGFTDDDVDGDGSDRVIDALVAWGTVTSIEERIRGHLEAGADHVCVQPLPGGEPGLSQLRELAPAVGQLRD